MRILVSNDDGVYADGLWILARQLCKIAGVIIVAPDREQSAVGAAVTLRKPLRVQKISPLVPGVQAYSVEGTPSDSVIVALGRIVTEKVDLVISGINQGSNMGEDVLISGTVGAALAAYLRGFNALAVSCGKYYEAENQADGQAPQPPQVNEAFLSDVSRFMAVLAARIGKTHITGKIFLNINFPDLPLSDIKGVQITRLAHQSHVNTVEEGHDGKRGYYMLMRQSINQQADKRTDIWAVSQGNISITPLHIFPENRFSPSLLRALTVGLLEECKSNNRPGAKMEDINRSEDEVLQDVMEIRYGKKN
jgi:5'-nucleotidase